MNSILAVLDAQPEDDKKKQRYDEIKSLLNHPDASARMLVLIEGPDDTALYSRILDMSRVRVRHTEGCSFMEEVLGRFNTDHDRKMCAIRDADFDHLNNNSPPFPNMFFTDTHDWETMTITPVRENAIMTKYRIPEHRQQDIVDDAYANIMNLSYIKWYHSIVKDQGNGLDFGKSAMEHYWGKSPGECLDHLYRSQSSDDKVVITEGDIVNFRKANPSPDPRQLHVGHDLLHSLSYSMKKYNKSLNIRHKDMTRMLYDSYTAEEFHMTALYASLAAYVDSCYPRIAADN